MYITLSLPLQIIITNILIGTGIAFSIILPKSMPRIDTDV